MASRRPYYSATLGKSEFLIDSRYQNLKPVGRGAYGLVAAADDIITGHRVAIKRVSRVFTDLVDAKRILREIKLLRHLDRHDNIIQIVDIMTSPPETENFHTLYIVTSLFECDLERIISSQQRLTDQHAQYFVYQILRALKYIHSARVLHRDLKPSNLLVNSNCDLAVCDFGLARGISDTGDTKLTEYVVTRWYRAPELLCESDVYGTPVDVWAVGCIFGEILGRRPLFKGSSTREQLELIIAKLGAPTVDDLTGISSKHVLEVIRRMGDKPGIPFSETFPEANSLALDLLTRMLTFDQHKRITVEECLTHPYLHDLHIRAAEPLADAAFDWAFERDFPDEMPQHLLQCLMFHEMHDLRAKQKASGLDVTRHLTPAQYAAVGILSTGMPDAPATNIITGPGSAAVLTGPAEGMAGGGMGLSAGGYMSTTGAGSLPAAPAGGAASGTFPSSGHYSSGPAMPMAMGGATHPSASYHAPTAPQGYVVAYATGPAPGHGSAPPGSYGIGPGGTAPAGYYAAHPPAHMHGYAAHPYPHGAVGGGASGASSGGTSYGAYRTGGASMHEDSSAT